MDILIELDIQMEWPLHLHLILTLLKLLVILLLLLLNLLRLKPSKLKGLICQITRASLIRPNLIWNKRLRHNPKSHNLDMLICTLDITPLSMVHKYLKIHNVIANIYLTPILRHKRLLGNLHNHNTKGMSYILGTHILLEEINLPMLNAFIIWPNVTLAMCAYIEYYTCNYFLWTTLRLTNLDQ